MGGKKEEKRGSIESPCPGGKGIRTSVQERAKAADHGRGGGESIAKAASMSPRIDGIEDTKERGRRFHQFRIRSEQS